MKVFNLTQNSKIYTSNAFLILGSWNGIEDVNTLIDVGSDESIIDKIEEVNTGLGKNKIDLVILTHSHSDHVAMLPQIIKMYNPKVYAFNSHLNGIDHVLRDGEMIKVADKYFEVIHTPIHSSDSICLFCKEDGTIFVGDTPIPNDLKLQSSISTYPDTLVKKWEFVKTIYFGHGETRKRST